MRYRCARPEGTRAPVVNALPLRYMSAITKHSGKNVRFVRFSPPPLDYYTKGNVLFAFAEAVAAGRRPESATGAGSTGCLHDRHYITLLLWCAAGPLPGVRFTMGVSFWLSLESYTGFRCQPLWSPPNLDHTLSQGAVQNGDEFLAISGKLHWIPKPATLVAPKSGPHPSPRCIPDQWGDLPDRWRLRPGRWVWPHLTDNQLACTHNNPGYTRIAIFGTRHLTAHT